MSGTRWSQVFHWWTWLGGCVWSVHESSLLFQVVVQVQQQTIILRLWLLRMMPILLLIMQVNSWWRKYAGIIWTYQEQYLHHFGGSIPDSFYSLTELTELYLFKNEFTGTLSSLIGQFDALQRLHLSHNDFTGPFPNELQSNRNPNFAAF